jgi:hypothetical protein
MNVALTRCGGEELTEKHDVGIRKSVSADAEALAEARYAFRAEINTAVEERAAFTSRGIHSLFLWPTARSVAMYERYGFEFGRLLENNLHENRLCD